MNAMGIVGFGNAGKTTLVCALADCLEERGLRVAVAKNTDHPLDKAGTDTAKCMKPGRAVAAVSRAGAGEAMIRWGKTRSLADLVPLLDADFLLVEGGKSLGWLPRVLCLRRAEEREELDRGLAVATWGEVTTPGLPPFSRVEALADLVVGRAFRLPGLDCGACGESDCAGLARRVVAGQAGPDACAARGGVISVSVNGQPVGLNPFTARMLAGGVMGMLSALKGYAPGCEVRISLKD